MVRFAFLCLLLVCVPSFGQETKKEVDRNEAFRVALEDVSKKLNMGRVFFNETKGTDLIMAFWKKENNPVDAAAVSNRKRDVESMVRVLVAEPKDRAKALASLFLVQNQDARLPEFEDIERDDGWMLFRAAGDEAFDKLDGWCAVGGDQKDPTKSTHTYFIVGQNKKAVYAIKTAIDKGNNKK